jgi:hypothetical protein
MSLHLDIACPWDLGRTSNHDSRNPLEFQYIGLGNQVIPKASSFRDRSPILKVHQRIMPVLSHCRVYRS